MTKWRKFFIIGKIWLLHVQVQYPGSAPLDYIQYLICMIMNYIHYITNELHDVSSYEALVIGLNNQKWLRGLLEVKRENFYDM